MITGSAVALVLVATWGGTQYDWTSPVIICLAVAGVACWVAFVVVESHVADPILPTAILANRTFVISTIVGMLAMGGMIGVLSYLPTYLQMVYGYSATVSGLLLVPMTLGMLGGGIGSGVLMTRNGRYKVYPVVGPLVSALAAFCLWRVTTASPVWQVSGATFLMGLGIDLFFQLLVTIVQNDVPARHLGTATSGNNFFREVAVSLGASLIGAAFSSNLTSQLSTRMAALAASDDPAVAGALARFQGGGADTSSLTPALVESLPQVLHDAVASSYAQALSPIFAWMIPLFVTTSLVALLLKEKPLSRKTGMEQLAEAGDSPA